jgi:heterodisulfide reductase subunit A
MAEIEGVAQASSTKPKIVAFAEGTSAYTACDLVGLDRKQYPTNVRIIKVPSVGRLHARHVLAAFSAGVDGVIMIEGEGTVLNEEKFRAHVNEVRKTVASRGIESMRVFATRTTIPQYAKLTSVFQTFTERIQKMGSLSPEKRSKIEEVAAAR